MLDVYYPAWLNLHLIDFAWDAANSDIVQGYDPNDPEPEPDENPNPGPGNNPYPGEDEEDIVLCYLGQYFDGVHWQQDWQYLTNTTCYNSGGWYQGIDEDFSEWSGYTEDNPNPGENQTYMQYFFALGHPNKAKIRMKDCIYGVKDNNGFSVVQGRGVMTEYIYDWNNNNLFSNGQRQHWEYLSDNSVFHVKEDLIQELMYNEDTQNPLTQGGSFFAVHPEGPLGSGISVFANAYFREAGSWNNWEGDSFAVYSLINGQTFGYDETGDNNGWEYRARRGSWAPNYKYLFEKFLDENPEWYDSQPEPVYSDSAEQHITKISSSHTFISWMLNHTIDANYLTQLYEDMNGLTIPNTIHNEVQKYIYPSMYLLDSSSSNKYHKLRPYACFEVDGTEPYSNVLFYNDTYAPQTGNDLGWDYGYQSGVVNIPEGSFIHDEPIFIPDTDYALKELWKKKDRVIPFVWISKNFDLGNQTDTKILSKIKIIYNNTPPAFEYMRNNDGVWRTANFSGTDDLGVSLYEDDGYCLTYRLPKDLKKIKSIKVKLKSNINSSTNSWDIYRERGRG